MRCFAKKKEIMIYLNIFICLVLLALMTYIYFIMPCPVVLIASFMLLTAIIVFLGFFTMVISIEKFNTTLTEAVNDISHIINMKDISGK